MDFRDTLDNITMEDARLVKTIVIPPKLNLPLPIEEAHPLPIYAHRNTSACLAILLR